MPRVNIPHVGTVNFPSSMSSSEIRDKAAHFHRIGKLSAATPSVDVTRSAGFAERNQQHAPEMKQFLGKTESLPDGRRHASLMDAHNAMRQVQSVPFEKPSNINGNASIRVQKAVTRRHYREHQTGWHVL
jgi:hypothetical protein